MPKEKTNSKDEPKEHKSGAKELGVFIKGQSEPIRTYSLEVHGEEFVENAEEFAAQDEKREVRKIR